MSTGATGQGVLLASSGDPDYELSCTPVWPMGRLLWSQPRPAFAALDVSVP
jgi:hypothetical protein